VLGPSEMPIRKRLRRWPREIKDIDAVVAGPDLAPTPWAKPARPTIRLMLCGSEQTRLIVLRGNSGSGKSSVARALRSAYGDGIAWVSQDLIRRTILKEKDRPGGANIGLIDQVTRYSLDHDYHVVLDGILDSDRYEPMLAALRRDHAGRSFFYYLEASLAETLRRHDTRREADEFTHADMRSWYRPMDLLTGIAEHVISQTSTLQQTTARIIAETGLLSADAADMSATGETSRR
jgi:predicted kinase